MRIICSDSKFEICNLKLQLWNIYGRGLELELKLVGRDALKCIGRAQPGAHTARPRLDGGPGTRPPPLAAPTISCCLGWEFLFAFSFRWRF